MEPDVFNLTANYSTNGVAEQAYVLAYWGFVIIITILHYLSWWYIFKKAGRPAWEAIIPIYNYYVMLKIIGKPTWWLILLILPLVNIIFIFLICLQTATVFNKGMFFALGLFFFTPIFYLILAFDKSKYIGFAPLVAPVNTNPPANPPINPVAMPPMNPPANPPTATPSQ